jgi:hypothetical protein
LARPEFGNATLCAVAAGARAGAGAGAAVVARLSSIRSIKSRIWTRTKNEAPSSFDHSMSHVSNVPTWGTGMYAGMYGAMEPWSQLGGRGRGRERIKPYTRTFVHLKWYPQIEHSHDLQGTFLPFYPLLCVIFPGFLISLTSPKNSSYW